jgi:hypothetical protein
MLLVIWNIGELRQSCRGRFISKRCFLTFREKVIRGNAEPHRHLLSSYQAGSYFHNAEISEFSEILTKEALL